MRKIIELLRVKIAFWLLSTKTMSMTATRILEETRKARCIHCGKNPYLKFIK